MTRRASETMLVRANAGDGSYSANWTPSATGSYHIHVAIDGYAQDDVYQVEVKEAPSGVLPPMYQAGGAGGVRIGGADASAHSRVRQFRMANSAGLRVRAHPSLQGEQIGRIVIEGSKCCILFDRPFS